MENEFNPDLQDTGEYAGEVDSDFQKAEENTLNQRISKLENILGGHNAANEMLDEVDGIEREPRPVDQMSPAEIESMDDFEFSQQVKPVIAGGKRQIDAGNLQLQKETEVLKRMQLKEYPELGDKIPYIFPHLQRANQENPTKKFEERSRIALERTVDYLGLRSKVNHRRTASYVQDLQKRQDRMKTILTPQEQHEAKYGKEPE